MEYNARATSQTIQGADNTFNPPFEGPPLSVQSNLTTNADRPKLTHNAERRKGVKDSSDGGEEGMRNTTMRADTVAPQSARERT
jgi:hypothetical protein